VSDAEAIAAVHVAVWRVAYRNLMPADLLATLDVDARARAWRARLDVESSGTLVAVGDERVVGFVHVGRSRDGDAGSGHGEVMSIYVHPDQWRRGHGEALLGRGLARLHAGDLDRQITLWVLRDNAPARAFYEASGFRAAGATKRQPRTGLVELRYRLANPRAVHRSVTS